MRISVIVTVYNRAEALMKALWSLHVQSRPPDEVIVSDDGSPLDIRASLEAYSDSLGFDLIYVRQEDRGFRLARCRNNGVRAASGEYLVFMDQDIVVTRGYLDLYAGRGKTGEFLVAYPVLLSEKQSEALTPEVIERGDYASVVDAGQTQTVRRQYRKDAFYMLVRMVLGRGHRPKLRGGAFGMAAGDFADVNGFDENYLGWGAEDDDLGRRLYKRGITGRTVFRNEFPLHLWHPHVTGESDSVNLPYYNRRLREIARGDYRAVNGLSNTLGEDAPVVVKIR
jgi:glycosyltransferase involved in cell wall biosynthesis